MPFFSLGNQMKAMIRTKARYEQKKHDMISMIQSKLATDKKEVRVLKLLSRSIHLRLLPNSFNLELPTNTFLSFNLLTSVLI